MSGEKIELDDYLPVLQTPDSGLPDFAAAKLNIRPVARVLLTPTARSASGGFRSRRV